MSWPCRSVPNQCATDGPSRLWSGLAYPGSAPVNNAGSTATTTTQAISAALMMNFGRRRSPRHVSRQNPTPATASAIANPWVQRRVQQVHRQIGDEVDDHEHRHDRHHSRGFLTGDGLVEHAADTVDVEDTLGYDRAAHQRAEIGPQESHHRDQ